MFFAVISFGNKEVVDNRGFDSKEELKTVITKNLTKLKLAFPDAVFKIREVKENG